MPPRPLMFDPTQPLRNERHEQFARLRALLVPRLIAVREAGYESMTAGNAAKLDRRKDIRARIAALSAMDEEIVRMKRERIESRLMKVVEADIVRDFAIVEKVMVGGVEVSKVVGIDWQKVIESEISIVVSEFSFDAETGCLTKFKREDALNAIAQLRDMLGFKAPTKIAPTTADGQTLTLDDVIRDVAKIREARKQAADLQSGQPAAGEKDDPQGTATAMARRF
jgi:hypothetical protein